MSIFFKALEQAERERALREQGDQPESAARPAPPVDPAPVRPPARATSLEPSVKVERPAPADVRPVDDDVRSVTRERKPGAPRAERRRVAAPDRAPAPAAPKRDVPDVALGEVDDHLVSLLQPMSPAAEQYRALRHVIDELHRSAGLSCFAVCSPTVGDGKTTTAINLAGALAQSPEAQVVLLEADLRQPAVAERIGMTAVSARGLVEAIESPGLTLDDIVRRRPPFDNLGVVLAGRIAAAPYEALESPRLAELVEEARKRFDYVVVDTPPILSVPDCRVISKWVDGFVVVVQAHRTPRKMLAEALNIMEPSKVIGLVFTRDDHSVSSYYAYGAYGARPTRPSMTPFAIGARQ